MDDTLASPFLTAEQVRSKLVAYAKQAPPEWMPLPGEKGVITGMLNKALAYDVQKSAIANERRQQLLAWLFGEYYNYKGLQMSSKLFSNDVWYALYTWIKPYKDEEMYEWQADAMFRIECALVAKAAQAWVADRLAMVGG